MAASLALFARANAISSARTDSVFQELSKILALRRQKIALRRGRQYLRSISGDGINFGLPDVVGGRMLSVVPWSRSFDDQILLAAINTDPDQARTAWVDLDPDDNPAGKTMQCLYSNDPAQIGEEAGRSDGG